MACEQLLQEWTSESIILPGYAGFLLAVDGRGAKVVATFLAALEICISHALNEIPDERSKV